GLGDVHPGLNKAEIEMRGGSSIRHAAGVFFRAEGTLAGFGVGEIVDVEMRMRLDAAGHDNLAGRVNRPPGFWGLLVSADKHNLSSLYADTPVAHPMGRNHLSATDYQVQHVQLLLFTKLQF